MTALAYGIHERLVKVDGIKPDTDEYFEAIDAGMRQRFPDYFEGGTSDDEDGSSRQPVSPPSKPSPVVAPSARTQGKAKRTVRLTATQVSLAKRLGLTPEQYAEQLTKELQANG